MGIDFHSEKNRDTYTTRKADRSWMEIMNHLVSVEDISKALDVGCGGGIYSKALAEMGIDFITGVDFSEAMLEGARKNCKEYGNISFKQGNALDTGLDSSHYGLVLSRALIHHIKDLQDCFTEAYRLLQENGVYIVQDRTPEDCVLSGDESHIRGYFFELFPRLIEKETKRRHTNPFVNQALQVAGFRNIEKVKLWETRQVYQDKEQLLQDLSKRTGRSILHELDDSELQLLVDQMDQSLTADHEIIEKDRWTIWKAVK